MSPQAKTDEEGPDVIVAYDSAPPPSTTIPVIVVEERHGSLCFNPIPPTWARTAKMLAPASLDPEFKERIWRALRLQRIEPFCPNGQC